MTLTACLLVHTHTRALQGKKKSGKKKSGKKKGGDDEDAVRC
jgi:hypothetical protein